MKWLYSGAHRYVKAAVFFEPMVNRYKLRTSNLNATLKNSFLVAFASFSVSIRSKLHGHFCWQNILHQNGIEFLINVSYLPTGGLSCCCS